MGLFKRLIVVLPLLSILFFLSYLPAGWAADPPDPPKTSLIVKTVAGLSYVDVGAIVARDGGVETSSIPALRLHVIEVTADQLATVTLNYQSDQQVESVEVNQTRKVETLTPPDPYYEGQWYLPRIGWDSVYGVSLPFYHSTVAILDTGVDASHPDLAGNIVPGTSIIDGSGGTTDPNGHGTSLAGIVAGVSNNIGITGVCFSGVSIMPVTVLGADGTGKDADIIAGILYAVDHGANVILMGFSNPGFSQNLQDAIDYAWSKNVVLVAATGNDAISDPTYPAGDRGVIGVSATDSSDALASFSNYGKDVFLAAPGVGIVTTSLDYNAYAAVSGTSASAAIAAGVAGYLRAYDATISNGVVVSRMAASADLAGNSTDETGNGRINMANAVLNTGSDEIEPAGAPGGGPYVGPYVAATYHVTSVSVGNQTGTLTYGTGGSVTYAISTSGYSSGTGPTLTISGLPSGATGVFSPATVDSSNKTSTLTVTTTSAASAVTNDSFTVSAGSTNDTGTLTIAKRLVSVTADAKSKTYGDSDPALTYSITSGSLVNGDSFTGSLTRASGESVGTHAIQQGTLALSSNYTLTYVGANLTITKATPTITWSNPADIVSGTALSTTQLNATASVPGTLTYTPAAGSVLNAGNGQTLHAVFTPTDTTDYNGATKDVAINVLKAAATVTLSGLSQTYDGTAKPATVSTTPNGLSVTVTYNSSSTAPTAAGSYAVAVTVNDTNYTGTASGTLTIAKATPVITWNSPADITYGTALGATQLNASTPVAGSFAYTPAGGVLNAGNGQTLHAVFTPTDTTDYNGATKDVAINVLKAAATVTLSGLSQTYDGTAKPATVSTTPNGLSVTVTYNSSSTAPTAAGSYAVAVTVNDTNYTGTASGTLTIAKATPVITWNSPADITYGTALGATQLNASTPIGGSFAYTPAAGAVLNAGSGQDLHAAFTPTDTTDYNTASKDVTINVSQAPATVTLGGLSQTYDGTAKPATVSTTPNGLSVTVTYNSSSTAPTAAGSYAVAVTVNDTNYTGSASGTLTIAKATPVITWNSPADITYGTALGATQLNASTPVAGSFAYTPAAGAVLNAGSGQTLQAAFTPTDTTDYNTASKDVTINVSQAPATVTLGGLSQSYDGAAKNATATTSPVGGLAVTYTYNGSSTAPTAAGSYAVAVTVNDTNYTGTASGTLTIAKATPVITWNSPADITYGTALGATRAERQHPGWRLICLHSGCRGGLECGQRPDPASGLYPDGHHRLQHCVQGRDDKRAAGCGYRNLKRPEPNL